MPNLLERYFDSGRQAGCPSDQMMRMLSAGVILQPKQLRFSAAARLCDAPEGPTEIGVGGARGGGKTHWLMSQLGADDCQRVPGLKCLLLRKVGKSNIESVQDLRMRVFNRLRHTFNASKGNITFENGSRIITGSFLNDRDIDKYLGLEYDVIGVEEATTLSHGKYKDIRTCCRTSKPNWRPRLYNTTNPGGIGHAWYKKLFIGPFRDGTESGTRFIPALVDDNAFVNTEYRTNLETLTGWQLQAWRHGDWDIAAGQFFSNWRHAVHVLKEGQIDEGRAKGWALALDYGFTHYTVALLAFWDGDGNWYVVDEHAAQRQLVDHHSSCILTMCARHKRDADTALTFDALDYAVAGNDIWSKDHKGKTIAADYAANGVRFTPANDDRVNGAATILRLLGEPDRGKSAKLFVHERCKRLIDCLPEMQHNPNRPEDVLKVDVDEDGIGGDDPYDALRYLLNSKPSAVSPVRFRGF